MVATNAIGMGLNLKINRIIFHSMNRKFKNNYQILDDHEVKQISGRAGRDNQSGLV